MWLLAIVTLVPAAALLWLSWSVVRLDRQFDGQRRQEWLSGAADRVDLGLTRDLTRRAASLPLFRDGRATLPENSLVIELDGHRILRHAGAPLLFRPAVEIANEPPSSIWEAGEVLEQRQRDLERALQVFSVLSRSEEPAVRAGALLRMAGVQRQLDRPLDALATYRRLHGHMADV